MNFARDPTNTDEYYVTALQIFECCGVKSTNTLRVDVLMDKLTPLKKTNKAEFIYLKSLLDPEHCNPEINVSDLADAMHQFSESQNTKVDLDESFNLLRTGAPQDSDSGISTDGLQILEELQCELREKEHTAQQLRSQLAFSDRQHEEAAAALAGERDELLAHLNMLREENASLSQIRRDYEEVCERLCVSGAALEEARTELDSLRRSGRVAREQIAALEADKLALQELLSKSKDECHRINVMYATRQSALLEENESLTAQHADLAATLQDRDEFLHQLIAEKIQLETELKDVLNKSNQSHLRLDRSIEVSYTEDQMLLAMDSLNADTRFGIENRILDEDSFSNALREDQGRSTNMSLFDEIRMSFNFSRINEFTAAQCEKCKENSIMTTAQTDEGIEIKPCPNCDKDEITEKVCRETQTCEIHYCDRKKFDIPMCCVGTQTISNVIEKTDSGIQTDCTEAIKLDESGDNAQNIYDSGNNVARKLHFETDGYQDTFPMKVDTKSKIEKSERENRTKNLLKIIKLPLGTKTENISVNNNSNNGHCIKCFECENTNKSNDKLKMDKTISNMIMREMELKIKDYENNLTCLEQLVDEGSDKNVKLLTVVDAMRSKIDVLETACESQREVINKLSWAETNCAQSQTTFEQTSVSTQADVPCSDCVNRHAPSRSLRRFFWEPLKCLFQLFAIVCFVGAISLLYGVSQRGRVRCERGVTPWRWFDAQDIMDLLLRIEYTAEVPM